MPTLLLLAALLHPAVHACETPGSTIVFERVGSSCPPTVEGCVSEATWREELAFQYHPGNWARLDQSRTGLVTSALGGVAADIAVRAPALQERTAHADLLCSLDTEVRTASGRSAVVFGQRAPRSPLVRTTAIPATRSLRDGLARGLAHPLDTAFSHPTQVSDARPRFAPAFYEQLHLDRTAEQSLERLFQPALPGETAAEFHAVAQARYRDFRQTVSATLVRYATHEHTASQLGLFATVAAMAFPPRSAREADLPPSMRSAGNERTGASDHHTDNDAERLVYALPLDVVLDALEERTAWTRAESRLLAGVTRDLKDRNLVRTTAGRPTAVSPDAIRTWAAEVAHNGQMTAVFEGLHRGALAELIRREGPGAHPELVVHAAAFELRPVLSGADPGPAVVTDVIDGSSEAWQTTVQRVYGRATPRVDQTVHASAASVCAPESNLAAEVVRPVHLDVVVLAPLDTEEVLWEAQSPPLLAMDDPNHRPHIQRLVQVGHDRALYRVRWRVWAGWHLLWSRNDEGDLVSAAAAICEDTVWVPDATWATTVRAGLLDPGWVPPEPGPAVTDLGAAAALAKQTAGIDPADEDDDVPIDPGWLSGVVHDSLRGKGHSVLFVADIGPSRTGRHHLSRTPYHRVSEQIRGYGETSASAWAVYLSDDPERPSGRIAPAVADGPAWLETTRGAHWLPKPKPELFVAVGLGSGIPTHQGLPGLDAHLVVGTSLWMRAHRAQIGLDVGLDGHLGTGGDNTCIDPCNGRWFQGFGGGVLGLSIRPGPRLQGRHGRRLWPRATERTPRWQLGVRALGGAGIAHRTGAWTVGGELTVGRSLGAHDLTDVRAWHPAFLITGYARAAWVAPLEEDAFMPHATLSAGFRMRIRMKKPELPEAPEVPDAAGALGLP